METIQAHHSEIARSLMARDQDKEWLLNGEMA